MDIVATLSTSESVHLCTWPHVHGQLIHITPQFPSIFIINTRIVKVAGSWDCHESSRVKTNKALSMVHSKSYVCVSFCYDHINI